ncbi:P-loop containing nucleoside triphosphate hydrolase protein [Piromyces finnis]|uniref:p-loop containing nucleoside triphosphate hydrolase protein n=1 Tax=Piromyces finnis TaxID=1754191 RepID=A0A1Y1UU64_9FUNG|nr:P-loop containing nucleoside triphosphate hydrolase protein [Piromyces finnis]|eukprot:ORX41563.1 P-loop containing nucleoside triphosphate hydrolase protein [Piromyces finnis]
MKNKKDKSNKEKKVNNSSDNNEIKKVSFFELFKYSSIREKFLLLLGVIFSILQGLSLPLMYYFMGDLMNVFFSLIVNISVKSTSGIQDDNILEEFINIGNLSNSTIQYAKFEEFNKKYPEIDTITIGQKLGSSQHSNTSTFSGNYRFMPIEDINHELYKYLIIYLGIGLASFIASFIFYSCFSITSTRQVSRIRSLVFQSLMKQDIFWYEKTSPGELTSRMISDTILIEEGIGVKVGLFLQNLTTFIACYAIACISGWKLTLNMAIVLPVILIATIIMGIILTIYTKKSQKVYGELGGIAQEAFSQIRTIVSFGNEQNEIDRYTNKLKPTKKYGFIISQVNALGVGFIFAAVYSIFCVAFIKGSQFIHDNEMDSGSVLKVFMTVIMGSGMLSACSSYLTAFTQAVGAASKLFSIIERKPETDADQGEIPNHSIKGSIEFRNVHFTYPSRPDIEILKGISFTCKPGKTIALVGSSGSGKSTIIQLLERYYNKSEGDIIIDGKKIENYSIKWLRSQIGLVSQEPILFNATIAENISIACPNATKEEIEEAAKLANAHDFITKLPNGYNTNAGERGLQLSGGQKQRICIARALIMNPKILLLDEATSALDNQSEKIIQSALEVASSGRTTIVIAHRLSTIKNADCIIVMDKGIITETGNHDELMMKQGIYYKLVKSQDMNVVESDNEEESDEIKQDEEEEYKNNINMNFNDMFNNEENEDISSKYLLNKRESTILSRIHTNLSSNGSIEYNKNSSNDTKMKKSKKNGNNMDWKRYLHYNKPVWWAILLGVLGSILTGCIQPVYAFLMASAMNAFNKQGDELLDEGRYWGLLFLLFSGLIFFAYYFQLSGYGTSGEYLSYTFRKLMYNSMIRQEIGFFDSNEINSLNKSKKNKTNSIDTNNANNSGGAVSTGTLTTKLTTETSLVQGLNNNIGYIFEICVTMIVGFAIAFFNSWKLTLILFCTIPLIFSGTILELKTSQDKNEEKRQIYETSTNIAVESIVSVKTVYALNLQKYFSKLYDNSLVKSKKSLERKYYINAFGNGFSNAVNFISYAFGFYFGYIFVKNGEIEFQNMFRVLMVIILSTASIGIASSSVPDYKKAEEAFGQVLKIIDRHSKIDANSPEGTKKDKFEGNIMFDRLRFSYPSRPNIPVLRMGNNKIKVAQGTNLAIVGGSGCGKSTLIGLLLRWYDAQHGEILIDNIKNNNYNIKWLRKQMGIVNQEPNLFNVSIKDNIRYGKENATEEEIINAAKKANIHDFIVSLPDGYNTLVGGIGTSQMSGGQKQRIAIARAMIRNPKILLLDEATSALDAESEIIIQKDLEEASKNRTTITIAHRLSTIKNADIIIVMKEGRILEMGNHKELMEQKGEYYEMVLAGDSSAGNAN